MLAVVIRAVVGAAEGIGDALAGGIGLAVDAVSGDLEQRRRRCARARRATSAGSVLLDGNAQVLG